MTNAEQTLTWLRMLFEPEDIFEVRVKTEQQRGAVQSWYQMRQKGAQFAEVLAPIHERNERHIWVGVAPREQVGSTTPTLLRALWVDLDASVSEMETVEEALTTSGLPRPTMIVSSGNGFHLYWKLKNPLPAKDARPYTKGVHDALPTDSTHDPTRVMRVPGTANFKDPENPKRCLIVEHDPERVYELSAFPKAEAAPPTARPGAAPRKARQLPQEDFDLFVANWLDGQKHTMAVGVSGYLRKSLGYSEADCLAEIERIHTAAGYEMDDNLRKVVRDTYEKPFAIVGGTSILHELGVVPTVKDSFTLRIKPPPKPRIAIIDFEEAHQEQEFWVDGLIGPGLLTLWAAEPKTGKSFAAMQIGHALSTGTQLWDFDTTPKRRRVLYFQGELTHQMVRQRARQMFGLATVRDSKWFAMTDKPSSPIDLVEDPEVLMDLAEHYDVIIVDPISVFNRNDETSTHSVNEVISVFDPLRAAGKAVLLVHHTRKLQTDREGNPLTPSFNDVRGSSAWFATADALALHYKLGQSGNTQVKFVFRAAPDREKLTLYRLPHGGFTHDRTTYLATQTGFRASLPQQLN